MFTNNVPYLITNEQNLLWEINFNDLVAEYSLQNLKKKKKNLFKFYIYFMYIDNYIIIDILLSIIIYLILYWNNYN